MDGAKIVAWVLFLMPACSGKPDPWKSFRVVGSNPSFGTRSSSTPLESLEYRTSLDKHRSPVHQAMAQVNLDDAPIDLASLR